MCQSNCQSFRVNLILSPFTFPTLTGLFLSRTWVKDKHIWLFNSCEILNCIVLKPFSSWNKTRFIHTKMVYSQGISILKPHIKANKHCLLIPYKNRTTYIYKSGLLKHDRPWRSSLAQTALGNFPWLSVYSGPPPHLAASGSKG